jgi:hypothetical protein
VAQTRQPLKCAEVNVNDRASQSASTSTPNERAYNLLKSNLVTICPK